MCSRQEEIHSAMCGSENMVRLTKWFPKNDALGYVFGKLRLVMCFRKNDTFGDVFSEKRYVCDVFPEKWFVWRCVFGKNDALGNEFSEKRYVCGVFSEKRYICDVFSEKRYVCDVFAEKRCKTSTEPICFLVFYARMHLTSRVLCYPTSVVSRSMLSDICRLGTGCAHTLSQ